VIPHLKINKKIQKAVETTLSHKQGGEK
jgi:hypothetical protein